MAANLAKAGLYVDDFNKLRILDPSIAQATSEFKEECAGFINKTEEFQSVTKTVLELFESISAKVEGMKIKTGLYYLIGSFLCFSFYRLRLQLQSLENIEAEQKEFIQNFLRDR
ncbi:unnamed protein product [Taenia asiatica]|uniref:FH2 domain-containing protein n=1 Tax=Taenia asiatica TaxID=60517 RepID=A0A0R3W453_TAEAS|nr:unnamed protein product [Taenia asiatica]